MGVKAMVNESWHSNAALWIAAVRGNHIPSRARVTNDAVLAAVLRHGPRHVLDIGCGEGWLAAKLSEHCRVTGFDLSPDLVEAARDACPRGDFEVLSYAAFASRTRPAFAGVAVANFSLFEENLLPLLQAVHRSLLQDGRLVIQTLHPGAAAGGWQTETFTTLAALGDWQPMPWFGRTEADWIRLLEQAGFDAIAVEEPRAPGDSRPASLLLTARRASSRGTGTPAPPSTRA